jgi:AcrR family transcriptional regulator
MKMRSAKETQGVAEGEPAELPAHWEARATNRVSEARGEQVLERSRRIVAAASDILAEEGLEGLTIRTVLTRTGLSRRAFYERFADKDDLVVAVFEDTIRRAAAYYGTSAVHRLLHRSRQPSRDG